MVSVEGLLARAGGEGWLVLCGSLPTFGGLYPDLAGKVLEHVDLSMPVVVLHTQEAERSAVDSLSSEIECLLEREIAIAGANEAAEVWNAAGLLALCGGPAQAWSQAIGGSGSADLASGMVDEGVVVLAAGPAAAAAGTWVVSAEEDALHPGLSWLPGAIILPGELEPASVEGVRQWLAAPERVYAIGLPNGSALALGPDGEVELWGSARPTIALGAGWRSG